MRARNFGKRHSLFQRLGWQQEIRFAIRSVGLLRAFRDGATWIALDFPAHPPVNAEPPAGLATALGRTPQAFLTSAAAEMTLAVLALAADVCAVTPDPTFIATLGGIGLIITAPGEPGDDVDFVSRFFAPQSGIPEDPVTGAAHCA